MNDKQDMPDVIWASKVSLQRGEITVICGRKESGMFVEAFISKASHLQELDKLKAEHLKAMEEQRKACDDEFWKYEQTGPATISRAILNATIEDKK